ncbi:MAG: YceD family protein, partial [Thermodesulfobacteriota bacterium]
METPLKIFTEQLTSGKHESIELDLPSDFLSLNEKELTFTSPVHLKGEAYVADNHLILQLCAQAEVKMPCSICNEMTVMPLAAQEIFHTILLDDIESTIFDFTDIVREEII